MTEKQVKKMFILRKPLTVGQRVELKTSWRRGEKGVVEECCGADLPRLELTGLVRYGVRLDFNGLLADMRAFELKKIK